MKSLSYLLFSFICVNAFAEPNLIFASKMRQDTESKFVINHQKMLNDKLEGKIDGDLYLNININNKNIHSTSFDVIEEPLRSEDFSQLYFTSLLEVQTRKLACIEALQISSEFCGSNNSNLSCESFFSKRKKVISTSPRAQSFSLHKKETKITFNKTSIENRNENGLLVAAEIVFTGKYRMITKNWSQNEIFSIYMMFQNGTKKTLLKSNQQDNCILLKSGRIVVVDLDVDSVVEGLQFQSNNFSAFIKFHSQKLSQKFTLQSCILVFHFSTQANENKPNFAKFLRNNKAFFPNQSVRNTFSKKRLNKRSTVSSHQQPCHLDDYFLTSKFVESAFNASCTEKNCWNIKRCLGVCGFPIPSHVNTNVNSFLRSYTERRKSCCVPLTFVEKNFLVITEEELIIDSLPDAIATSCGCR